MAFTAEAEEMEKFCGLLIVIDGGIMSVVRAIELSFPISAIIILSAIVPVTCTPFSRQIGFSASTLMVKYSLSSLLFT